MVRSCRDSIMWAAVKGPDVIQNSCTAELSAVRLCTRIVHVLECIGHTFKNGLILHRTHY